MIRCFGWELSMRVRLRRSRPPLPVDTSLQRKILKSYSQYYEDLFLHQIFGGRRHGFYIDIGANDPEHLNNTKKFSDMGWCGINVEPNPRLYQKFCEMRPRDVNLNYGVADRQGEMIFYEMDPDCYSTFDKKSAMMARFSSSRRVVRQIPVEIIRIDQLFSLHDGHVDLLTVDTEGYDYRILSANDWSRNRPSVIMVEVDHDTEGGVCDLLRSNRYHLVYYNHTNGIFVAAEYANALLEQKDGVMHEAVS